MPDYRSVSDYYIVADLPGFQITDPPHVSPYHTHERERKKYFVMSKPGQFRILARLNIKTATLKEVQYRTKVSE